MYWLLMLIRHISQNVGLVNEFGYSHINSAGPSNKMQTIKDLFGVSSLISDLRLKGESKAYLG